MTHGLVRDLARAFPAYADIVEHDEGPHYNLGQFARFLIEGIESGSLNDGEITKAFSMINSCAKTEDSEVQSLVTVGILEILTDSEKAMLLAREKLEGPAARFLEEIDGFWH